VVEFALYVDVNVFIYWLGDHPEFADRAMEWIRRIERSRRGSFITSTLTVYEALIILSGLTGRSLNDRDLIGRVIEFFLQLSNLTLEPLSPKDLLEAYNLMEAYNLDYEDSLHLAVALRVKSEGIISNDGDFDRAPLKRLF